MKIKIEKLTKVYKNLHAVDDLSVEIGDGELVCLLGPSGCGKSTTLFMLAGLTMPDSGAIYFDDERIDNIEAEKRDIGMVFQDYALYPHMTVEENIAFPLKMKKVKKAERLKQAREMAELMQIEDLLKRKPSKLSGGQQQRVAIARALVKHPKLLLLDEPLSNLDARLRIELREDIRRLQQRIGITTIFVTHDQEEAMSISDRILILNKGVMQQFSNPREMYKVPCNEFVARFLGNPVINMYDGRMQEGRLFISDGPSEIEIYSGRINIQCRQDGKVRMGIRPEDIVVTDSGELSGMVGHIQTLGKELYLYVDSVIGKILICTKWDRDYEPGKEICFFIDYLHIFEEAQNDKKA